MGQKLEAYFLLEVCLKLKEWLNIILNDVAAKMGS